jgi:hypothetical protein
MKNDRTPRRSFLRRGGTGTLDGHRGLRFQRDLSGLMNGTVNFKGFYTREIAPNDEFYVTGYSDLVPVVNAEEDRPRVEGLVRKPRSLDDLAMPEPVSLLPF